MIKQTTLRSQCLAFCNQYQLLKNLTILPFETEKIIQKSQRKGNEETAKKKISRKLEHVNPKKNKQDDADKVPYKSNQNNVKMQSQKESMLHNLINDLRNGNNQSGIMQNTANFYYPNQKNNHQNNHSNFFNNPTYGNYSPNNTLKFQNDWVKQLNYTTKYSTKPTWAYDSPKIYRQSPLRSISPLSVSKSGNIGKELVHTPKNKRGQRAFYDTRASPLKKSTSQNKISQIQPQSIDIMGKLQQVMRKQTIIEKNEFRTSTKAYTQYPQYRQQDFYVANQQKNRLPNLDDDLQQPISYISQSRTVSKPIHVQLRGLK